MPTRYAILIGCNYAGTSAALGGCVDDILNMKAFLLSKKYTESNVVMFTDDRTLVTTNKAQLASKANLFGFFASFVPKMKSGG